MEICKLFIEKLLSNGNPAIGEFMTYIEKEKKLGGLKSDEWNMTHEFAKAFGKTFPKSYNVDDSWPTVFDEYYYDYCEKKGISLESNK